MKSNKYWPARQRQLLKALETSELKTRKRLYRVYKAEAVRLADEIDAYYSKYGVNGVVSFRALKEKLTPAERDLLYRNMNAFQLKHPEVNLEIASSVYKIDRLEALQQSLLLRAAELGIAEQDAVRNHLTNAATMGADTAAEIFGKSFQKENTAIIERVVNAKWSNGANFSERIWDNRNRLARDLNTRLAQGFARGDSRAKMVKQLSDRFVGVSKSNIDRLVYTEGTYVMNEAQAAVLEDTFMYYKTSPMPGCCPHCDDIASETEHYPVRFEDREPGINFPPLHPWCRCTFDIVIPDRMAFMRQAGTEAENLLYEIGYED